MGKRANHLRQCEIWAVERLLANERRFDRRMMGERVVGMIRKDLAAIDAEGLLSYQGVRVWLDPDKIRIEASEARRADGLSEDLYRRDKLEVVVSFFPPGARGASACLVQAAMLKLLGEEKFFKKIRMGVAKGVMKADEQYRFDRGMRPPAALERLAQAADIAEVAGPATTVPNPRRAAL